MKSYVKLLGPSIIEALHVLETITIEYPKVCMMSRAIIDNIPPHLGNDIGIMTSSRLPSNDPPKLGLTDWVMSYTRYRGLTVSHERCMTLISKEGSDLGEYDFFYEWLEEPSYEHITELIAKIDTKLSPTGCMYTLITK